MKKLLVACQLAVVLVTFNVGCSDDDEPTNPGNPPGPGTDWLIEGAQVDTDFSEFLITLDDNRNVTRVRYTFTENGEQYDFSGSQVTGDADLEGSFVTLDADWSSGDDEREIAFLGEINDEGTIVDGDISYNVEHGSDTVLELVTAATLTEQQ